MAAFRTSESRTTGWPVTVSVRAAIPGRHRPAGRAHCGCSRARRWDHRRRSAAPAARSACAPAHRDERRHHAGAEVQREHHRAQRPVERGVADGAGELGERRGSDQARAVADLRRERRAPGRVEGIVHRVRCASTERIATRRFSRSVMSFSVHALKNAHETRRCGLGGAVPAVAKEAESSSVSERRGDRPVLPADTPRIRCAPLGEEGERHGIGGRDEYRPAERGGEL